MHASFLRLGPSHRRLTLAIGCLVLAGLAGFSLLGAQQNPNAAAQDASLTDAVRAAILTDMTIVALPAGSTAGHVTVDAVSKLKDQLVAGLSSVYTGPLLTTKLRALTTYVDAVASSENIAVNTGAGITSLTIDTSILSTSHATVHGKYSVWVTGRHMEDGQIKDDRAEASYTFAAGLDRVLDKWLVSSWDDQQVS